MKTISDYTIYCTQKQTKKALELGAQLDILNYDSTVIKTIVTYNGFVIIPTAEQMIGFILDSDRGYAIDLAELIKEYGYKQGCLTFINMSLF